MTLIEADASPSKIVFSPYDYIGMACHPSDNIYDFVQGVTGLGFFGSINQ